MSLSKSIGVLKSFHYMFANVRCIPVFDISQYYVDVGGINFECGRARQPTHAQLTFVFRYFTVSVCV